MIRLVRVGGMGKGELLAELRARGVELNNAGQELFADSRFTTSGLSTVMSTVELSVAGLGCPGGATYPEILERAAKLALSSGPLELAPHLRLQYLDQPEGANGYPGSLHRAPPGSITIASPPIASDEETPVGFYLRRINGVLWLRGFRCRPEHVWSPEDRFVFCSQGRS